MIGIRYFSFAGGTGYAQAARRYLTGLARLGAPVTWTPMLPARGPGLAFQPFDGRSIGDPDLDPLCNRPIDYDLALLHAPPHYFPSLARMVPGKRIAAYTVWETDRVPRRWRAYLENIDVLIVPSEWNRKAFRAGGFERPIAVVPHSLDGRAPLSDSTGESSEFVFYSINSWSDRKAVDLTLEAFLRAFTSCDRVRLVLKTSPRHESWRVPFTTWKPVPTRPLIRRIVRGFGAPPPVTVITDSLSNEAVIDVHRRGNCFVSLTRAEAWGLGAFDAAAAARPVIITGYGGQTEFLAPDLAHLVRYDLVRTPFRPWEPFERGDRWARPDVDHAARLMREVFEKRDESRRKARELARRICADYENVRVGGMLLDALRDGC